VIDATSLAEVWDACADRLLLIARSFGGPAEDAVQEAFIALATQPQLPDDPMGWLVRVTRNQLLQWHRSHQRQRRRESLAVQANWFESEVVQVDRRIDGRRITAALQQLPSPQREIIVMHLWGGLTFEAIGQIVDTSRASANRSFHQGLDILRSQFSQERDFDSVRACHEKL
jgi:RNA polymerase sigma-70 factor (ECF subfamily)